MNCLQSLPWEDDPFPGRPRVIVWPEDALWLHVDRADSDLFDRFSAEVVCYNSEAMARVWDVVNYENALSYDLHFYWLSYARLLVAVSDVFVVFHFHIFKFRVLLAFPHIHDRW